MRDIILASSHLNVLEVKMYLRSKAQKLTDQVSLVWVQLCRGVFYKILLTRNWFDPNWLLSDSINLFETLYLGAFSDTYPYTDLWKLTWNVISTLTFQSCFRAQWTPMRRLLLIRHGRLLGYSTVLTLDPKSFEY